MDMVEGLGRVLHGLADHVGDRDCNATPLGVERVQLKVQLTVHVGLKL